MVTKSQKAIKISHSPDSDDAFMFHAIANHKIDLAAYDFSIDSAEIEKLNELLFDSSSDDSELPDICAVSFHAYAYIADRFQILKAGSSMGSATHGPRVVMKSENLSKLSKSNGQYDFSNLKIAIPGKLTSAYLCLQLYQALNSDSNFEPVFCSFDEVFDLVQEGKVDAGLLIHESQLKIEEQGLEKILDLGSWWFDYSEKETGRGLAMPLGCNVIKRSLGDESINEISRILQESIKYGLDNFDETLDYARKYSNNGLDDDRAKEYIGMYVNDHTVCLSDDDVKSIELMLSKAAEKSLLKTGLPKIDLV